MRAWQAEHLRTNDAQIATAIDGLGQLRLAQRNFPESESLLGQALAMRRETLGTTNYFVTLSLNNLAQVQGVQGRLAEAESALREALALQRTLLASNDLDLATTLENLGIVLLKQGKATHAEPFARECLGIREERWPDNWRASAARSLYGGCLLGLNRPAEAEPLLITGCEGLEKQADRIPFNNRFACPKPSSGWRSFTGPWAARTRRPFGKKSSPISARRSAQMQS